MAYEPARPVVIPLSRSPVTDSPECDSSVTVTDRGALGLDLDLQFHQNGVIQHVHCPLSTDEAHLLYCALGAQFGPLPDKDPTDV